MSFIFPGRAQAGLCPAAVPTSCCSSAASAAQGHAFVRIEGLTGLLSEIVLKQFIHHGHAGRATGQQHHVNIFLPVSCLLQHLASEQAAAPQQSLGELLEQLPAHLLFQGAALAAVNDLHLGPGTQGDLGRQGLFL